MKSKHRKGEIPFYDGLLPNFNNTKRMINMPLRNRITNNMSYPNRTFNEIPFADNRAKYEDNEPQRENNIQEFPNKGIKTIIVAKTNFPLKSNQFLGQDQFYFSKRQINKRKRRIIDYSKANCSIEDIPSFPGETPSNRKASLIQNFNSVNNNNDEASSNYFNSNFANSTNHIHNLNVKQLKDKLLHNYLQNKNSFRQLENINSLYNTKVLPLRCNPHQNERDEVHQSRDNQEENRKDLIYKSIRDNSYNLTFYNSKSIIRKSIPFIRKYNHPSLGKPNESNKLIWDNSKLKIPKIINEDFIPAFPLRMDLDLNSVPFSINHKGPNPNSLYIYGNNPKDFSNLRNKNIKYLLKSFYVFISLYNYVRIYRGIQNPGSI